MTTATIQEKLLTGLKGGGLRLKLLREAGNDIPADIAMAINRITHDYREETLLARVLTAKIMASALSGSGAFTAHSDDVYNFGGVALAYAKENDSYEQVLKRLVRCTSQSLKQAQSHIYSLAVLIMRDGKQLNFNRLYGDLLHWDDEHSYARLNWASAYCPVRDDN